MNIPELKILNNSNCVEKHIKNMYPDFHEYIINHYPVDLKWTEKLYWYYHGLTEKPKCPVCGNFVKFTNFNKGYRQYCSYKCLNNSEKTKELKRQTCLNKYGVDNPTKNKVFVKKSMDTQRKRYGGVGFESVKLMDKTKNTNLERYGVEYTGSSEIVKEKIKQTWREKYGVDHPWMSDKVKEKIKQTTLEKYGVENVSYTQYFRDKMTEKYDIIQQKQYNTKKSNHSFNTSKIEESFSIWLTENNINFIRQYRSEEYPFACDFYFPDKDLYLEIQGTWTHGHHPFDPNNEDDLKILESWKEKNTKFYNNAIDVWTKSDPLKREIAKENNLNWVEVFSDDLNALIEKFNDYH